MPRRGQAAKFVDVRLWSAKSIGPTVTPSLVTCSISGNLVAMSLLVSSEPIKIRMVSLSRFGFDNDVIPFLLLISTLALPMRTYFCRACTSGSWTPKAPWDWEMNASLNLSNAFSISTVD
jgi:hypothetical protein